MASIQKRNKKYCVIYSYIDEKGKKKQKWETYRSYQEALKRQKEIEYKQSLGNLVVPNCKTVKQLMAEYVKLYGRKKWALSTYEGNVGLINNYILPAIGDKKLSDINTHFLENYYQRLLETPATENPYNKNRNGKCVGTSTVRDIHKILRSCFKQAVKWDLMEKNPALLAEVPEHNGKEREIWDAKTMMYAIDVCEDKSLKLAMNLSFACCLRMGELLGLTWDCVDVSEEAIEEHRAFLYVNKEVQRVQKESLKTLDEKDVIYVFPEESKRCKTVRILKKPKTESSIRRVFIPKSVALMLVEWKAEQDELKELLGDEYSDFNLVMATSYGMPKGGEYFRKSLNRLIKEHNLPKIVFHSIRHSSVTYKLKLNGGDIKSVQGDSGHSQADMVTRVYSHIIDEDRRYNADRFEEAFYQKKDADPEMHGKKGSKSLNIPDGVDADMLQKVLENPETAALLSALVKSIGK